MAPATFEEALAQAQRFAAGLRNTLHMEGVICPRRAENRIEIIAKAPGGRVFHATYFPGGKTTEWLRTTSLKTARTLIEV